MRPAPLLVLAVLCLPVASAQTPEDVVLLACATAGSVDPQAQEALPVCPRAEPAAPAPAAQASTAPPPPAPAAEPAQLADAIADEAARVVKDPTQTPGRLAAITERVVAFVRDLVRLPADAAAAGQGALAAVADATRAAATGAVDAARDALGSATAALRALADRSAAEPRGAPAPTAIPSRGTGLGAPLLDMGERVLSAAGPHPGHS